MYIFTRSLHLSMGNAKEYMFRSHIHYITLYTLDNMIEEVFLHVL